MAKIKFPNEMAPATTIAGEDKILIADAVTGESKQASWNQAKQYLNITGIELEPLASGALPTPPMGDQRKMEVVGPAAWTHASLPGGSASLTSGQLGVLFWNGSTWALTNVVDLPTVPVSGEVIVEDPNAVSGDKTFRAINNKGANLLTEGNIVKSVSNYPIAGKAIVNGNGGIADNGNTSITEAEELPEDWTSVVYYHFASTTYGIAFYNAAGNALSLTLPNTQDAIIEIKKADYPLLATAKYVRNTVLTNNPAFNYKRMLVIKSDNSLAMKFPKINRVLNYDDWLLKEENSGNYVVEYDYKALPSTPSAGLKRSAYIDLNDWNSLAVLIPKSSSQKVSFLNESYVEVGSISGNPDYKTQYSYVNKSSYPTARYVQVTGLDSDKDNFILSISYNANKKLVDANRDIDAHLAQKGLIVEYLSFNESNFPNVGVYQFNTGTINTALTQYRASDLRELPIDWYAVQYDNFLSSTSGLVFFDEFKRYIGFNPNSSTSEVRTVTALRENFSNARYYGYGWGENFKDLSFKIIRDVKLRSKPIPPSLTFLNTRMANLDITNLSEWNGNPANTDVAVGNVFNNTEIPGRGFMRIPTMAISNLGTDLVVVEARNSGEDKGQFDIYLKRRVSGGSWVAINLFPYNSSTYGRGMNPSIVVDKSGALGVSNRIYVFCGTIKNDTQYAVFSPTSELDLLYRYSDDDGASWSAIESLKASWNTSIYTAVIPSCAAGIQMTDGTLVIPTMVVRTQTWRSGVLYKKPGGIWTFSTFTPRNLDNECNVLEVGSKLILSCRTESQEARYRTAYEYDFVNNRFIESALDISFNPYINCKASIVKVNYDSSTFYLMSYPDSSKVAAQQTGNTRYNLTVWASIDGKHWIRSYVVQHQLSMGYSELAFYNDNLKIVYEVSNPNLVVDMQDLTPLLDKFKYDALVNSKLTAEERMNRLIYFLKDWTY